jgi:hypothetical protein
MKTVLAIQVVNIEEATYRVVAIEHDEDENGTDLARIKYVATSTEAGFGDYETAKKDLADAVLNPAPWSESVEVYYTVLAPGEETAYWWNGLRWKLEGLDKRRAK